MWLKSIEQMSMVVVGLLVLRAALPWLRRRWSGLLGAALSVLIVVALCASSASAVEFRHRHGGVVKVAKGEVIPGTLVAAGETVLVEGTVEGDLVAAGERVEVRGTVKGNVIAAGGRLFIGGNVDNSALLAGHVLTLEGTVKRNVYAAGANIELTDGASVLQSLFAAAEDGAVNGKIGDSLIAAMARLRLAGEVAKDIRFRGGRLTLSSGARVGGDLLARTRQPAQIDAGAKIGGKTTIELIRTPSRYLTGRFYLRQLIWLLGGFLVGLVLLKVFPGFYGGAAAAVRSIWRSLGLGLGVLCGVPVAVIVVGITLVGLPLALITVAIYLIALCLAKIFVAAWLGRQLLKTPAEADYSSLGALFLGLFILTVAGDLPYIGGWIRLVVLLVGLGAFAWQAYWQVKSAPATA